MMLVDVRAVLFDVDGTLLDTTEFILGGFEHTIRTHGGALPSREELRRLVGPPLDAIYARVLPDHNVDQLIETHRGWQTGNLHLSVPYEGALDTLAALRAAGLRMAAITNRSRRTSLDTLRLAGLTEFFETVISFEDMTRMKPDPEGLHTALAHLGVAAAHAVMVGDTDNDVLAGKAAGARTVGVSYGFHGHEVAAHAPDAIIHNLRELLPLLGVAAPPVC